MSFIWLQQWRTRERNRLMAQLRKVNLAIAEREITLASAKRGRSFYGIDGASQYTADVAQAKINLAQLFIERERLAQKLDLTAEEAAEVR